VRKLVIGIAVAAALAVAGTAGAGCFATVGISPLPGGVDAGETWTVDVRVLQHGRTPMADATPVVVVANTRTGERLTVPATPADVADGRYRASVVFPSAGTWSVAVDDGFPVAECAQTHTFGTYAVGDAPTTPPAATAPAEEAGSFPVLPIALGIVLGTAALVLAAAVGIRVRRAGAA
jgi:hypothetical protein